MAVEACRFYTNLFLTSAIKIPQNFHTLQKWSNFPIKSGWKAFTLVISVLIILNYVVTDLILDLIFLRKELWRTYTVLDRYCRIVLGLWNICSVLVSVSKSHATSLDHDIRNADVAMCSLIVSTYCLTFHPVSCFLDFKIYVHIYEMYSLPAICFLTKSKPETLRMFSNELTDLLGAVRWQSSSRCENPRFSKCLLLSVFYLCISISSSFSTPLHRNCL